ncbi:unnamed protein product, partial [Amoebophrya sp. A120]
EYDRRARAGCLLLVRPAGRVVACVGVGGSRRVARSLVGLALPGWRIRVLAPLNVCRHSLAHRHSQHGMLDASWAAGLSILERGMSRKDDRNFLDRARMPSPESHGRMSADVPCKGPALGLFVFLLWRSEVSSFHSH